MMVGDVGVWVPGKKGMRFAPGRERVYTSRLMTSVRRLKAIPVALHRVAIFLLAAAQLCVALASFSEGRYGADARAHVEASGTSLHHAHDEASCAACTARGLLSVPQFAQRPAYVSRDSATVAASQRDERPDFTARSDARPRAPPVRQA